MAAFVLDARPIIHPLPFFSQLKGRVLALLSISALLMGYALPGLPAAGAQALSSASTAGGEANPPMQFTSGGHALSFTSQGMIAAAASHTLRVDFLGANRVQPQSSEAAGKAPRAGDVCRSVAGHRPHVHLRRGQHLHNDLHRDARRGPAQHSTPLQRSAHLECGWNLEHSVWRGQAH